MIPDEAANTVYQVRWAREEEWAPSMQMIWRTFLKFEGEDYSDEGIRNFFDLITDDGLYVSFLRGEYRLMVALDGDKIIGAGSLRNRNRLSLLFVDEAYHLRGIGRELVSRLCRFLKEEAGEHYMSVLASPYAVDFYRRLGFRIVRPEEEISGIRVTAMEKMF